MSDAFISYSRKDAEFVQRLNTVFVQANRVIWIDWQNIPRGEDWWREIERGIEDADAFLCVVSEHWLTSEICQRELSYSRANHKRVVPLIRQKIEGDVEKRVKGSWMDLSWEQQARENWDYLRHLNWMFFDIDTRFDIEFPALLKTLESDQPHIKAHTRYQNLALEWERSGRNPSYLLNGENLAFAEGWLKTSIGKDPAPTSHQQAFITSSRDDEKAQATKQTERESQIRRFRWAAIGLGVVGILAVLAAIGASAVGIQSQQSAETATVAQGMAVQAQGTALAQADMAQNGAATATWEQGRAQNAAARAEAAQVTAQRDAQIAQTQVAIAGMTLTPMPPTVTALAAAVADAKAGGIITSQLADAMLRVREGSWDAALRISNSLVERYPNKSLAYFSRGLIYDLMRQTANALTDYNKAIALDPTFARVYMNRGLIYATLEHFDYAFDDYAKSIELDPTFARTYNNRGSAYLYLQQYNKAIEDFNKVIEIDQNYTQAYINRGSAYRILKQHDKAIEDFSKAIELTPNNANLYSYRGNSYKDLQQYDMAIADFTKTIDLNSQYTSAYNDRGTTYYFLKQYVEALADWTAYEALGGKLTPKVEEYRMQANAVLNLTATPTLPIGTEDAAAK